MMNQLWQYAGPQTFWNQHAVNARERYYYGYGGYYGPGYAGEYPGFPARPDIWRKLKPKPIKCDALTQDCWSKPRDTITDGYDGCRFPVQHYDCTESFDDSTVHSGNSGLLGIIGLVTLGVFICKALGGNK